MCIRCLLLFCENLNMKIIKNLIVNIVICSVLLYVFNYYQLWIKIEFLSDTANSLIGLIWIFLVLGFVFWVFNSPIKWILKTLSCPINFLTMWLMSLVINVLVFYIFAYVVNNIIFKWEVAVHLWEIRQTVILSFIMAIGISILNKIL